MSNIRGRRDRPYKVYHYRKGEKWAHGVELAKDKREANKIARKWKDYGHRVKIVKRKIKRMR